RKRFDGRPEYVVNFMRFVAQEVREYLAQLGFRTLAEAVGHAEVLDVDDAVRHWKTEGMDLAPIFAMPQLPPGTARHRTKAQDHGLEKALDNTLIQLCEGALRSGDKVRLDLPVRNVNRTVGTMLGYEVTTRWGAEGLPDDTIDVTLTGSAGQSFGAFLPRGVTLRLVGDSNDYVGKGLSGGRIIVRPDRTNVFPAEHNVIAGNVIGYGATGGELFLRGQVGERFLVRNSGATAVVEGIGDHGCEYMTGGQALILGRTGRNFGAGMSGGTAFVLDLKPSRVNKQALDSGDLQLIELDDEDRDIVRNLLVKHIEETDSALAQRLLDNFDDTAARITKVLPRDYAAVLQTRLSALEEGLDPDGEEVWSRILEVTGG
ncbi:MAG: glutamate synthase subunit alpha, partial [Intrasporangium sp.]